MNGTGYSVGLSCAESVYGVPVSGGVDVNFIPSTEKTYYGITTAVEISTAPGKEVHATWGETKTIAYVNLFELFDKCYKRIKEL